MKKPNLFILGAPKCGTTAVATWLTTHPDVFVSPVKEPHFFSEEYRLTPSLDAYESLFVQAGDQHKWVCEASVWYLFSATAVPNILRYAQDARLVIMIRNPVEMAASMHAHQRFNGNELVEDLREALLLSDSRSRGEPIGVRRDYGRPEHLAYFESCALGWQVERLLKQVSRDRLHVVVFDDLATDPESVYRNLLAFLELREILPPDFGKVNSAKRRKWLVVDAVVLALARLKRQLGIKVRLRMLSRLRKFNVTYRARDELPIEVRVELAARFRDDISLLESLVNRNLRDWIAFDAR